MEGFKNLDDNSIDLIVTSPPYNIGSKKGGDNNLWKSNIDYENYTDDRDEEEYQKWQIELLNEMYRVLTPGGSVFYNHKARSRGNRVILPSSWIEKSQMIIRQVIIWDRMGSVNVNDTHFLPTTEYIYWLTKSTKDIRFKRQTYQMESGKEMGMIQPLTEVWREQADMGNEHPAPYPIALVDRIIPSILAGGEGNIVVLDPFMGSGTTAISAIKHNCEWIGFEMSEVYKKMAEDRIAKHFADQNFGENLFGEKNRSKHDFSFEEMQREKKVQMQEKGKAKNIKDRKEREEFGEQSIW